MKKYFGTDGVRGKVGAFPVNVEFVLKLGWALGRALIAQNGKKKVLIGKDTRISGYMFESALQAGLSAAGVDIHLLGPMPTPGIAYLTRTFRADAGIVISASHNLYGDNGIKIFSAQGEKISDELEFTIERLIEQPLVTVDSAKLGKAVRIVDAAGRYVEFCKSTISSSLALQGLKIVIDCANGATYHVAPKVYRELGADVIEIASKPNGLNINQECGSTHVENLIKRVREEKADLGIALDGDGDRIIMIDHLGEVVDGDELMFIMVQERLQRGIAIPGVVGTLMTNLGLELALKEAGINMVRAAVGDRYVMQELKERDWKIGGESSGHIVCLDLTTTGDGIISSLQVLQALQINGQTLHQAKKGFQKFPQVLINIRLEHGASETVQHPAVQEKIHQVEDVLRTTGRVLVRASGTEPLVRVMVEGQDDKQVQSLAEQLAGVVAEVGGR